MTHNLPRETAPRCPSAYALDKALILDRADDPILRHLDDCPTCRLRREAAANIDTRFADEIYRKTLPAVSARIQAEQQNRLLRRLRRMFQMPSARIGLAAAAAAAIAVLLVQPGAHTAPPRDIPPQPARDLAYTGDKGAPGLEIYAMRADEVFRVHQGDTLFPGDSIRFVPVLSDENRRYVMVVSLDAAGTVSRYFPEIGDRAAAVDAEGAPLPGAVILDETVGAERIWLLVSDTPFSFASIQQAIESEWRQYGAPEQIGQLPIEPEQTGILFFKGRR